MPHYSRTWLRYADAESFRNGIGCFALGSKLSNLLANLYRELRATDFDALGFRSDHTGLCTLTDLLLSNFAKEESSVSRILRTRSVFVAM